jgi:hypothetical protein
LRRGDQDAPAYLFVYAAFVLEVTAPMALLRAIPVTFGRKPGASVS